jgi:hypothetical protein
MAAHDPAPAARKAARTGSDPLTRISACSHDRGRRILFVMLVWHVSVPLTRVLTPRSNKKLIAKDLWLRFQIWKFLVERGWGRAPQEINIEVKQNVDFKYTRAELAKLSLEQISQLWREEIAAPAGLIEESRPASD